METKTLNKATELRRLGALCSYAIKNTPKHAYHNSERAMDVLKAVSKLADLEKVSKHDKFLLQSAAALHYIGYEARTVDDGKKSIEVVRSILPEYGYSEFEIEVIGNLITATRYKEPRNELEMIMCDAEIDILGRENFFQEFDKLRQEIGIGDRKEWYSSQLVVLESNTYHTESAIRLRQEKKLENIRIARNELIESLR